jgi:hypothetical protein
MKRIRLGSVLLLVVLVVLGCALIVQQRREERLRAALAAYQSRSQGAIVRIMGDSLPLDWQDDTSLEEVIELISLGTSNRWDSFPKGVPIFVDPVALRQAGKTLKSPVKAPPQDDEEPLTFRLKLRAVLEPLGLACQVKEGALLITSRGTVDEPIEETPEDGE